MTHHAHPHKPHPPEDYVPETAPEHAHPRSHHKAPVTHAVGDKVKVSSKHTNFAGKEGTVVNVDEMAGMCCVDDGKEGMRAWFSHAELEKAE